MCVCSIDRWFKHISEAAEAYKLRTKGNHDHAPVVDDPATVTLSSSSNRESLDQHAEHDLRHVDSEEHQRDSRKLGEGADESGESNNNGNFNKNDDSNYSNIDGCNNGSGSIQGEDEDKVKQTVDAAEAPGTKNKTRTLTQQSSLVAPNEVQISISPALRAEPVLTQAGKLTAAGDSNRDLATHILPLLAELLRRLDESIRQTLAEKQRIVCDIFKVPNEHFAAIADIAGQPEAPKVSVNAPASRFAQC